MQKLQVYVLGKSREFQWGLTRNLKHVLDSNAEASFMAVLTAPLPSFRAYAAFERWQVRLRGIFAPFWRAYLSLRLCPLSSFRGGNEQFPKDQELILEIREAIARLITGRLLTEQQVMTALRAQGYWPGDISRALDLGTGSGSWHQMPGISQGPWGTLICTRCNSEAIHAQPCLHCGLKHCPYCQDCANLGGSRGCSTFLTAPIVQTEESEMPSLHFPHDLTLAQRQAAEELLRFWRSPEKSALVWAACGAGKTEVTFPLIQQALGQGRQVLFAIPRTDIVREVGKRLQAAFPEVVVAVHHGGRPVVAPGNLVVATTHQVLRFYRRFDLVILDEADAFPYQGNELLRFGLQRALATKGRLIEMTATPQSLKRYGQVITIPARFHGQPLPEPEFRLLKLPAWTGLTPEKFPAAISRLIRKEDRPWLVFVPTIACCTAVYDVLSTMFAEPIALCHSKEPDRGKTVQSLYQGKFKAVVTTSVLERGVNFPNISALVLYAEHPIFCRRTLIQMAGRVGRKAETPQGSVLFVANQITMAMRQALQAIQHLNRRAREKGLLTNEHPS